MEVKQNYIVAGDCIEGMQALPAGSVDLVFADPPFNTGYHYDVYDDRLAAEAYKDWSRDWIAAVHRILNSTGTFWLAIGDEYAADLKLLCHDVGFHFRSWVIWYYTFGVNCSRKFTRSHTHLLHMVKDPESFTFREDAPENRIPSARQLVYNDKRANPRGRLPDDTWIIPPADLTGELMEGLLDSPSAPPAAPIDNQQTWTLRPQDLSARFQSQEDTWYFPRVAGTFKERTGFHGCQMPEQLLGRIIRSCSDDDQCVVDPFSGSATTLAVAKKLGRSYLGFEISEDYVRFGRERLESIRVGDALDGSPEPLLSAPQTARSRPKKTKRGSDIIPATTSSASDRLLHDRQTAQQQRELTCRGVRDAFRQTYGGYSVDRVVIDPELNQEFQQCCNELGLAGDLRTWNILLFRLRKRGELADFPATARTKISWNDCDPFLFASEIALQRLLDDSAESLDEVLCDPLCAATFDDIAASLAPGYTPLQYRWAALKLRKQAAVARTRGAVLAAPKRLGKAQLLDDINWRRIPEKPGMYRLSDAQSRTYYVGETLNLQDRLKHHFAAGKARRHWRKLTDDGLRLQTRITETSPGNMLAWQSCLMRRYNTALNYRELRAAL